MKITITHEFDNPGEAFAFLQRMMPGANQVVVTEPAAPAEPVSTPVASAGAASVAAPAAAAPAKPPRKPRADAGKPRGPYKTGQEIKDAMNAAEAAAKDANGAGAGAPTDTPTATSGPEPTGSAPVPPAASAPAASSPGKLTLADVRAKLEELKNTEGLGMPACMDQLKEFGVNRISAVKEEQYPDFVAKIDAKIAAVKK